MHDGLAMQVNIKLPTPFPQRCKAYAASLFIISPCSRRRLNQDSDAKRDGVELKISHPLVSGCQGHIP